MKTNCWMILGAMLSTSLLAQQATNPPPAASAEVPSVAPAPAPALSNAPTARPEKKKGTAKRAPKKKTPAEKKPAIAEKPVMLVPGPAVVAGSNVNVRGQATLNSEVIIRLNKGDAATVLEQINLEKPKADEPTQWAKIALPTSAHVWVNASFIDATNKTVLPRRLNLRGGPGENFSVVGLLERGTPVKEITSKGTWMEIEAPAGAYAFVAAQFLQQEAPAAASPPPVAVAPAPAPTPVTETQPAVAAPAEAPVLASTNAPAPTETPATAPAPEPAPAPAVAEEPLPKRVVQHEGVVRGTWSIQAPTKFALVDPATGKSINYLYTTTTNLDLSRYRGLRIIVTGEESLDERWSTTPVITIQRIQVVE